jgi:hypothetical protein
MLPMPLFEQEVFESVLLILLPGFVEVVHVKLAYEWCVIVMPEVHWEDGLWKFLDFFDDEAFSVAGPWDDVRVFAVL